jgi:magnesium-transporting ATPase (P-type)
MKRKERGEKIEAFYHDTNLQIIFAVTLIAVLGVSSISPAFYEIGQIFSKRAVLLLIVVFTKRYWCLRYCYLVLPAAHAHLPVILTFF